MARKINFDPIANRQIKPEDYIPNSKPLSTRVTCRCGKVHEIEDVIGKGIECECGWSLPPHPNIPKREGEKIKKKHGAEWQLR